MDISYHRNIDLSLIILFLAFFRISKGEKKECNDFISNSMKDSFRRRIHLYGCRSNTRGNGEEGKTMARKYIYMVKNRESSWAISDDNSSLFLFFNAPIQGVSV